MKTKDEIREEAEKHCNVDYWGKDDSRSYDLDYIIILTDFTHSQLKEQQEEIELLKAENQELRLMNYEADELEIDYKATYLELQSKQKEIDELSEILERVNYMISLNQKIKSNGEFHNKVKQLLKPPCTTSTYGDLGSNK
jgi:hypothetical protein